jgi:hypothetical protein
VSSGTPYAARPLVKLLRKTDDRPRITGVKTMPIETTCASVFWRSAVHTVRAMRRGERSHGTPVAENDGGEHGIAKVDWQPQEQNYAQGGGDGSPSPLVMHSLYV